MARQKLNPMLEATLVKLEREGVALHARNDWDELQRLNSLAYHVTAPGVHIRPECLCDFRVKAGSTELRPLTIGAQMWLRRVGEL